MIRILIVDDDKLARKGLISIMPWSSHGMEVVGEAANGAKALEFLKQNTVDLMFVDLSMPVMSGIELIQVCKKLYPDMHYVVLTFHEDFEYVQAAMRLGVIDYISKVRLEMEDYEQIFSRIEKRLSEENVNHENNSSRDINKNSTKIIDSETSCLNQDKKNKLEQDWCSLYWLFDETQFDRLCDETRECGFPIQYIEVLFMRVCLQIESITHININIWRDYENIESAIDWIHNYRSLLYKSVSETNNLMETSICILKSVIFICNEIAEPLSAEIVAEYVSMSRSYFCECFKKFVGLTFNDYLRQERIRMAQRLLKETDESIAHIAKAVGYSDVKYFSRIFHEQINMLPSEFRLLSHDGGQMTAL